MSVKEQSVEFVRYVLSQICEDRGSIDVVSNDDDRGTLLTVTVAESDMGKLIGKDGQTIDAIRLLVRSLGARENVKINLKVVDPQA